MKTYPAVIKPHKNQTNIPNFLTPVMVVINYLTMMSVIVVHAFHSLGGATLFYVIVCRLCCSVKN